MSMPRTSRRPVPRSMRSSRPFPRSRDYRHGPDLGLSDGNFDYVIVGEYASIDDYVTYRDHPDHQRVIADYIKDRVSARAAVQYDAG